MQYSIDTLSIEIARLQKTIREFKSRPIVSGQEQTVQAKVAEFENQIREMKRSIHVLKDYAKTNNNTSQYTSRLMDPDIRYGNNDL